MIPLVAAGQGHGVDDRSAAARRGGKPFPGRWALYLSVKTVESHLRNIFAKAGVGSRDALAAAVNREARSGDAA